MVLCRLCLQENCDKYFNIKTHDLATLIEQCVTVFNDEDILPKLICNACNESLHAWSSFKEKCVLVNSQLIEQCRFNANIQCTNRTRKTTVINIIEVIKLTCDQRPEKLEYVNQVSPGDRTKHDSVADKLNPVLVNEAVAPCFRCDHCDKSFVTKQYLNAHLRYSHPAEGHRQKYVCKYCDRNFARPHRLRSHLLIHTGERPFICPNCGKSFNRIDRLREHETTHQDLRNIYNCNTCLKEYTEKRSFMRHKCVGNLQPDVRV